MTTNQILFYANELTVKLAAVNDVQPIGGFVSYLPGLFASTVPPGKGRYPQSGTVPTATKGGRANTAGAQVTLYAAGPTALIASDLANSYATEVGWRSTTWR